MSALSQLCLLVLLMCICVHADATMGKASTRLAPRRAVDGYVSTPFGWQHPSCVTEWPSNTTLMPEKGFALLPNGALQQLPACSYPFKVSNHASQRKETSLPPDGGWVVDALWIDPSGPSRVFQGFWRVPDDPPAGDAGQIVYLFTGLQPHDHSPLVIAQPVLEYSRGWTLASWYCCTHGHSNTIPTKAGHIVNGTIIRNADTSWTIISTDMNTTESTTLNVQTIEPLQDYYVTLESYQISSCADYPKGSVNFYGLRAENVHGQAVTPQWQAESVGDDCGEKVAVQAPSSVTIHFGTNVESIAHDD